MGAAFVCRLYLLGEWAREFLERSLGFGSDFRWFGPRTNTCVWMIRRVSGFSYLATLPGQAFSRRDRKFLALT